MGDLAIEDDIEVEYAGVLAIVQHIFRTRHDVVVQALDSTNQQAACLVCSFFVDIDVPEDLIEQARRDYGGNTDTGTGN